MEFVDNTGHIFSLPHYDSYPYGYEYNENKYVFWIDSTTTNRLSVGNYYMRTIYFLVPYNVSDLEKENLSNEYENFLDGAYNIEITIESNIYSLVSTKTIQESLANSSSIFNKVPLTSNTDIKKKLTNEDLYAVIINDHDYKYNFDRKYLLIPLYVIGNAQSEGSWTTNILIHATELDEVENIEYWCPITIGGLWAEENEALIINGQNMGIDLPKDILKAVYQCQYDNNVFDEQLWNEKIKEYLLNYMAIKGEIGNFNSAISSLKWFGYNNILSLSALLRTDNQYKIQYVKDFFNISTDILESFSTFHNSALLSLVIKLNNEIGKTTEYDFSQDFYGEDNPILEDLMKKLVPVKCGINEPLTYWKTYYNFSFIELGLKLSALKYYYDKYFLPIHISLNSATLQHKVYTNDIKMINKSNEHYVEKIMYLPYKNEVEFSHNSLRFFTHQLHYVDDNFNEFKNINNVDNWYYINDSCINIPIKFKDYETLYNCVLILEKINTTDNAGQKSSIPDSNVIYESHFSFIQHEDDESTIFSNFVIYPKMLADAMLKRETNQLLRENLTTIYYWINSEFLIRLLVNNKWYTYRFTIKLPDLNINIGTLHYKYYEDDIQFSSKFRQLKKLPSYNDNELVFNAFMYEPQLVEVNNINFFKEFIKYLKLSEIQYISEDELINNSLMYYFYLNDQKIAINKYAIDNKENIYIPFKYLSEENLFIFRYNDITVFLNEAGDRALKVVEISENEPYLATEEGYINTDEYLVFKYDPSNGKYYTDVNGNRIYVDIYEFLYNNIDNFITKYSEIKNIVNSDKYKNQIHIFNLYKRNRHINNKLWNLHNDIDIRCKGIRFIHKNFIDNTLYIQGQINSDIEPNDDENRYSETFNTHDDYTLYSVYWNDKLVVFNDVNPKGYVYYIKCTEDGKILSNEYADDSISKYERFIQLGSTEMTYNEFDKLDDTNATLSVNGYNIHFFNDKIITDIKDDVNGLNYSEVFYKFELLNYDDLLDTDIETFKKIYGISYSEEDSEQTQKIKFTFYYKQYYTVQNIEKSYDGEVFIKYKTINGVNTDEIDYYYGKLGNNKIVKLTPYYDYIQYKDMNLNENQYDIDIQNYVLSNQPSRHWYNIDTYEFNVGKRDLIDQSWVVPRETEDGERILFDENYNSQTYTDDIRYNNYLETDVTNYIKNNKWYMLSWDSSITINDEEQEWEGINLALYRIRDNQVELICNQKDMMIHLKDVQDDDKYIIFIQITGYPSDEETYFRGSITPKFIEVYDQYDLLEYNDYLTEDENVIEYTLNGKTYRYGSNTSNAVKDLYSEFFEMYPYEYTQDGTLYHYDILKSKINISSKIDYDQYLMHDDKYWYLVYISSNTIDKINNIVDLYPKEKTINFDGFESFDKNQIESNINSENNSIYISSYDTILPLSIIDENGINENYDKKYQLRLVSSNTEFLPNRYYFKSSNGINHFNREDLIAAKIENNERLPINICANTKWNIIPYSIGIDKDAISESNAEMIIFDVPDNENYYTKGYYTVNVKYSVSGYTTQQWSRNAMIRIE